MVQFKALENFLTFGPGGHVVSTIKIQGIGQVGDF